MAFAALRHFCATIAILFASQIASAADQPPAQRFALLVGVNEYEHNKLKALRFAENDVTALSVVLKSAQYQVTLLTTKDPNADLKPTKANIEKHLASILQKCRKGDTVVVAFSGHGLQFEGEPDAFFCPADAKPFKENSKTLVSIGKVYQDLDKSFATSKVLFVDACRDDPAAGRGASRGVDASSAPPPPQGVAALFSCGAGEQSFESPKFKHGVFFFHVIEGLKGKAADGDQEVTFASLASYVSRRVRRDAAEFGDGAKQSPNLKADYNVEPVLLSATRGQTVDDLLRADWLEYCRMWDLGQSNQFREKHAAKRLEAWRLAAEAGDARGQALYSTCLIHGVGVEKNRDEGLAWMRKAADQGEPLIMVIFGGLLRNESGKVHEDTEAVKWYRRAAERGFAPGQCLLGFMLANGRGAAKDESEAVRLYHLAADQGYALAQANLGYALERGAGTTKDEKAAIELYRKAAAQNNSTAMNFLGIAYANGHGVEKNDVEAVAWYRKAAELGLASAQDNLGFMLANGRGVLQDDVEAVKWYRKAADQGNAGAKNYLGIMFENGRGVEKNEAEAFRLYREAGDAGNKYGAWNTARCYEIGRGVPADRNEAINWYRKANALGHPSAKAALTRLGVTL